MFTTLADISLNGRGYYGIGAAAVPYSTALYTYLRITDINDDGTLNLSDLKSVADKKSKDYLLQPNDIVFARTGASTGRNYFYDGTDGELVYAGFLIKFSINPQKINPKYVKYYCLSKQYKAWIRSFLTGSTRGNINAQTLGKMPIPVIKRNQQNALVSILEGIDQKIKLNRKINENLEQQAQAIFKSWFVDFEPFERKCPISWKLATIDDLSAEIVCGKTPSTKKSEYYGDFMPFITIPDMHDSVYVTVTSKYLSKEGAYLQSKKTLPMNSICVSCIGTAGLVSLVSEPSQTNQQINSIIPKSGYSSYYIYLLMRTLSEKINSLGRCGSTIINLNKAEFGKINVVIPSIKDMQVFDSIVSPIFDFILNNIKENQHLATLRDTLLPRLMSGELDVSNLDI